MKKTILIALLLVGMASTSFAAQVGAGTNGTALGLTAFKTSSNVKLFATATDVAYTAAVKHKSGDVVYTATADAATITEGGSVPASKGYDITDQLGTLATSI